MSRRILAAALCVVLAATVAPAFAAPKLRLKPCPTFADPKGDADPLGERALRSLADPALDITSVKFKQIGSSLAMMVTVDKMADRPAYAWGNRFQIEFMLGERLITVYYKTSATRAQEASVIYQAALTDGAKVVSRHVGGTFSGNTMTMTLSSSELKTALGPKTIGSKITGLKAIVFGSYIAQSFSWDTSVAPASMTYVLGAPCAG